MKLKKLKYGQKFIIRGGSQINTVIGTDPFKYVRPDKWSMRQTGKQLELEVEVVQ